MSHAADVPFVVSCTLATHDCLLALPQDYVPAVLERRESYQAWQSVAGTSQVSNTISIVARVALVQVGAAAQSGPHDGCLG